MIVSEIDTYVYIYFFCVPYLPFKIHAFIFFIIDTHISVHVCVHTSCWVHFVLFMCVCGGVIMCLCVYGYMSVLCWLWLCGGCKCKFKLTIWYCIIYQKPCLCNMPHFWGLQTIVALLVLFWQPCYWDFMSAASLSYRRHCLIVDVLVLCPLPSL